MKLVESIKVKTSPQLTPHLREIWKTNDIFNLDIHGGSICGENHTTTQCFTLNRRTALPYDHYEFNTICFICFKYAKYLKRPQCLVIVVKCYYSNINWWKALRMPSYKNFYAPFTLAALSNNSILFGFFQESLNESLSQIDLYNHLGNKTASFRFCFLDDFCAGSDSIY
ncbi:hypothetical protein BpHYR1_052038 [Brachionus plicatilis]|uniref:Uncharacterized protein n=1 Tax=Brachionus plicatilis TaxID=10195 RepID=A0A3M7Q7C6_BRAPC|nr:hypothetical protein BpHYR1_052038 [Brachionus plicatilis]